jgi:hypothetical protein
MFLRPLTQVTQRVTHGINFSEDSKVWLFLFPIETEFSIPCPRDSIKGTYLSQ